MKPHLSRFFVAVSWVLIWTGAIGTILMGLAMLALDIGVAQKIASLLPAAVMLLTLSVGTGAMLRVLVSIDQRLATSTREP